MHVCTPVVYETERVGLRYKLKLQLRAPQHEGSKKIQNALETKHFHASTNEGYTDKRRKK
jgi:hypothetical protein